MKKIVVSEKLLRLYKSMRTDVMESNKRKTSRRLREREEKGRLEGRKEGLIFGFAAANNIEICEASAILLKSSVDTGRIKVIDQANGDPECVASWILDDILKPLKYKKFEICIETE